MDMNRNFSLISSGSTNEVSATPHPSSTIALLMVHLSMYPTLDVQALIAEFLLLTSLLKDISLLLPLGLLLLPMTFHQRLNHPLAVPRSTRKFSSSSEDSPITRVSHSLFQHWLLAVTRKLWNFFMFRTSGGTECNIFMIFLFALLPRHQSNPQSLYGLCLLGSCIYFLNHAEQANTSIIAAFCPLSFVLVQWNDHSWFPVFQHTTTLKSNITQPPNPVHHSVTFTLYHFSCDLILPADLYISKT